jgi:aminocarboxymuconate-semialdehyde decarboxylase
MGIARRAFLAGLAAAGGATLLRPHRALAQQGTRRYKAPVIDAHVHWYPPAFGELIEKEGAANGVTQIGRTKDGEITAKIPGKHPYSGSGGGATFRRNMTDSELILKMADERDVDITVMTQTNPHILRAPPAFGAKLAQAINDGNSALHVKYPKRFLGTITLPMQDVPLALKELERARKLPGMPALNMTENILGKNLSDKSFWPVWERCEALGLPLFLKNVDPISERLVEKDFSMMNVLGNPFEATIAATSLMLGGVLDAFPKLDVYLPHAGGFFAFVAPRIDFAMQQGMFKHMKQPASAYLRRFHYDLILHSPKLTRTLIDQVGADRVVSGTDFPQAMSIRKPIDYVEAIPGITRRECEMILCENPARLLKLDAPATPGF